MFALGRGQRELIVSERASGKTAISVDCMINQKDSDVVCVYVRGGPEVLHGEARHQRRHHPRRARPLHLRGRQRLRLAGAAVDRAVAGVTMAEYFRDRGQHALVVIDDLTRHAATHREIALLTRQPPGREAYPGDVFYIHAASSKGGKARPGRRANLISITDGQIVLDSRMFYEGTSPPSTSARASAASAARPRRRRRGPLPRRCVSMARRFLELEIFTRVGGVTAAKVKDRSRPAKDPRGTRPAAAQAHAPRRRDRAHHGAAVGRARPRPPRADRGIPCGVAHLPRRRDAAIAEEVGRTGDLSQSGRAELCEGLGQLAKRFPPDTPPEAAAHPADVETP